MADFRRWILAFAALILVLGSVVPASAQVTCNASAVVIPTLRHEGFTELTGDILLTCTAPQGVLPLAAGTPIPQATVSVSLSAPVTSRVLGKAAAPTPNLLSEALLLVNDPAPATQVLCTDPTNPAVQCQGTANGAGGYTNPPPNVYEGLQGATTPGPNTITFFGVPADPPATTRTYRITNIRIDATTAALGAGGGGTTPVYAFVSVSPSSSININSGSNSGQFIDGQISWGLVNTAPSSAGATLYQCENFNGTLGSVTFTENFSTAFKTQGVNGSGSMATYPQNTPGQVYYTESGLEIDLTGGSLPNAWSGAADAPTELQAVISNIPVGAVISVDSYAISTGQALCTATSPVGCVSVLSDANLLLPTANPSPGSNSVVTVADNSMGTAPISVTVVWQITDTNPSAIDSLTFNVYGSLVAQLGNPSTLTGPAAVSIGFYPQTATYADADSTGPIPSFSTTVEAQTPSPTSLFSISPCETILLFPYVTDFYGFDTGIAISNTSMDSLGSQGAVGQTGACTVSFFGNGGAATTLGTSGVYSSTSDTTLTTGLIPPGTTWAFSVSTIDPGYNSAPTYGTTGYAIATCEFQYAHGYSFVSDTGIRNFAAAYLALIIPDSTRAATPFICSAYGTTNTCNLTGEQLVH
ncbi:MAG TPA: hypothetical protein VN924_03275 [Bryobacteraceae bacterium]|nr:hypothetical protein [Bryobacteraceae bacterium]